MAAVTSTDMGCNIKQVDEKHVSVEIRSMAWSPKMDLLAVANANEEVALYRLSWQKVWSHPPLLEDCPIVGLAWRPDGKVLAVAYSRCRVVLLGVEKAELQHTHYTCAAPTAGAFSWIVCSTYLMDAKFEPENPSPSPIFEEHCNEFLPRLPGLNKDEEEHEPGEKLPDNSELSLLVVGCENGAIHLYAYGLLCIANICLADYGLENCTVVSACLSRDLGALSVAVTNTPDPSGRTATLLSTFAFPLLASRRNELKALACKFVKISALLEYCNLVIKQMQESWEDILLEMDIKLMRLAEKKKAQGTNSMMHDFMELLMFGSPSEEMQSFLLNELTEKGLKKLGMSTENYYASMQRLVVRNVQSALDGILYHLVDLQGMASWYERFGVIGLSPNSVKKAVMSVGSLLLKASELSLVVDTSSKNLRAFFKWLYITILRLSEESLPADMTRLSAQDFTLVAEFLKENFIEADEESNRKWLGFRLEKVGQYLKEEDIHVATGLQPCLAHAEDEALKKSPWTNLVESSLLKESELVFTPEPKKSLVKMFSEALITINEAFTTPADMIGKSLERSAVFRLFEFAKAELPCIIQFSTFADIVGQFNSMYTVYVSDRVSSNASHLSIMRQTVDLKTRCVVECSIGHGMFNSFGPDIQRAGDYSIVDIKHCTDDVITVLLARRSELYAGTSSSSASAGSVLLQLSLADVGPPNDCESFYTSLPGEGCDILQLAFVPVTVNLGTYVPLGNVKIMDNVTAKQVAVSGQRKVASVLKSNGRRVLLFMLDAEEDDDEDDLNTTAATTTGHEADTTALDSSDMENKENSKAL